MTTGKWIKNVMEIAKQKDYLRRVLSQIDIDSEVRVGGETKIDTDKKK